MRDLQMPMYASWSLTFALLGDTFLYTFLPIHALSIHLPVLWIGVLLSINRFVRILVTPWMGALFHQFGFRNLTIAAAALAILSTAGYGLGWGVAGWLVLRIVWGLSFAVLRISSLCYALDHAKQGFSLGVSRSIVEIGPMIALMVGPWVLAQSNAFLAFGVLALGSLPALWFALQLPDRQDALPPPKGVRFNLPSLVNFMTFVSAFAVEGLVVVAAGVLLLQSNPTITVATVTAWVAAYLLFRRISSIVLSPAGGWLADRYGFEKVYAGSLGLIGLGLLLLAGGWVTLGLLILFTFHSVNASLAVGGALSGIAPTTHGVAENAAWRDAGAAIGALTGGFLISYGTVQLTLLLSSLVLLSLVTRFVGFSPQRFKNRFIWK